MLEWTLSTAQVPAGTACVSVVLIVVMPPEANVENVARASNIAQRCCAVNIVSATTVLGLGLGAAAGVARNEAREDACEDVDLLGAQLLEEAVVDRGEVAGLRPADQVQAAAREVRLDCARVLGGRASLDELAPLERVDDPRDAAQAQAGGVCKGGQAHRPSVGCGQAPQALGA